MKLTKEELIKFIQTQFSDMMKDPANTEHLKSIASEIMDEMASKIVKPDSVDYNKINPFARNIPHSKIDGGFLTTTDGSIINLKDRSNPWVAVSKKMEEWARDFAKYLKTGDVSKLLSTTVDESGGYLVPDEFRAVMIMYEVEPTLVWSKATVLPMSGKSLSYPKLLQNADVDDANFDHFAGVTFSWTDEGGEKTETQPEFGMVELIVHELAAYTELTNTLLDDSAINLVNYLTRLFRAAWYWVTDKSFIDGTGGKRPLGILNDPGVLVVNRQSANDIQVDDILNMEAKLPSIFDSGAIWFITKKGRAKLRGQKVSNSSKELVLQETFSNISDGYNATLLGKPAYLADGKIPALGTTGDVIYGNWMWYYVGFRQDFSMDSSRHYKFRNNRTALRCSGRIDGQTAIPQAFVVLGQPS